MYKVPQDKAERTPIQLAGVVIFLITAGMFMFSAYTELARGDGGLMTAASDGLLSMAMVCTAFNFLIAARAPVRAKWLSLASVTLALVSVLIRFLF